MNLKQKLDLTDDLVILKVTHTITEDDLHDPTWKELYTIYEENQTTEKRVITSIWNSIYTQKRAIFCLSRDSLHELVTNDKNWSGSGFDTKKYRTIIAKLLKTNTVKVTREGKGRRPTVYEVVDPDMLGSLKVDKAIQLAEALAFSDKGQILHEQKYGGRKSFRELPFPHSKPNVGNSRE